MEWINRLNKTIRYMEEHLTEEIDYERLAQIACCSPYHFQIGRASCRERV